MFWPTLYILLSCINNSKEGGTDFKVSNNVDRTFYFFAHVRFDVLTDNISAI